MITFFVVFRAVLVATLIIPQLAHADPEKADRGTYRMKFESRWTVWTRQWEHIPDCKDDNIVPGVRLLEVRIDADVTVNGRAWTYGKFKDKVVATTTRPGKRLVLNIERRGNSARAWLNVNQGDETSSCASASHFVGTFAPSK